MNEALTLAKARITCAMEVLSSMKASNRHVALEDRSAILSAETLLRGALSDLSDRSGAGGAFRASAPRMLMDTISLDGTDSDSDAACSALPFRLSLAVPDFVAGEPSCTTHG